MSDETVEQGALEAMPPVEDFEAEPKQARSWLLPVGIGVAGVVLASLTGAAGYALGSERGESPEPVMMAESGEQHMQGPGSDEEFGERGGQGPGRERGGDHGMGERGGHGGKGRDGHMGDHHGDFNMDGDFGPGQGMNAPGA